MSELAENPFADRRVRALLGLSGGLMIATVAVLFIDDPTTTYLALGFAVLDVIVTPYVLGRVATERNSDDGLGQSHD